MAIHTFQIGSEEGVGLRVAVARRPPRGVKKENWPELFDVWFPVVAPSAELLKKVHAGELKWEVFTKRYATELRKSAEVWQSVLFLAEVAKRTPVSIGCYCPDESHCHRGVLKELIEEEMS